MHCACVCTCECSVMSSHKSYFIFEYDGCAYAHELTIDATTVVVVAVVICWFNSIVWPLFLSLFNSFNHCFIHSFINFSVCYSDSQFSQWEMCTTFLIIKPWMNANERLSINFIKCEKKILEIILYLLLAVRCDWIFLCDEMRLSYVFHWMSNLCTVNSFKFRSMEIQSILFFNHFEK